jgi:hypothetical protein
MESVMNPEKTAETQERLRNYASNPPEGSALRRAIEFGVDPTLTFHNMFVLSPEERLQKAGKTLTSTAKMLGIAAESVSEQHR